MQPLFALLGFSLALVQSFLAVFPDLLDRMGMFILRLCML